MFKIAFLNTPILRYTLPFLVFSLLNFVQSFTAEKDLILIYAIKILITLIVLIALFKNHINEIKGAFDIRAVLLGIVLAFLWIVSDNLLHHKHQNVFNPHSFKSLFGLIFALSVHLLSSSIVIPLLEEIFWRSFFMRFLINMDFYKIEIGTFSLYSFIVSNLIFSLMHGKEEWIAAFICGLSYSLYLIKTKNLMGCIISHGVTNFILSVYVILTKNWQLW